MALTPEDVLKKSFGSTQFRRGYDEREVDDFLDEVVAELRELIAERDDYKRKYEESVKRGGGAVVTKADDERVAAQAQQIEQLKRELAEAQSRAAAATAPAKAPAAPDTSKITAELERVRESLSAKEQELARVLAAKDEEIARVREDLAAAQQAHSRASAGDEATKAAGVLAMAQQLHDQLVAQAQAERERLVTEGSSERERLVSEGQARHSSLIHEATAQHDALLAEATAQHDALLQDAKAQHASLVGEAQSQRAQVLASLEEQRTGLERDIATLRSFESKYKQQLVGFLEGKLHEAKSVGSLEPRD